jgi:dolichol kinase
VGTSIGRHKLPYSDKKSLEGTFSGLIVAFLVAMLFVTPFQAFIGSLGGMFMESAISMRTIKRANIMSVIRFFINDNFLIPIFSSALMFYAVI